MTSLLRISLLIIALFTASCCPGATWPITLYMDESWSETELDSIQASLDEWLRATGSANYTMVLNQPHGLDLDTWHDAPHIVHRVSESDDGAAALRKISPNYIGMTSYGDGDDGSIVIAIDLVGDDQWMLKHVMLHELGHLYGFCGHHANTLMGGNAGIDLNCIDALVLEAICEQHECVNPRTTCD